MTREWEAILRGDPRGQPVLYYRGLVALVSCDPPIAVVTKDGSTVAKSEWEEIAKLIADAPRLKEENARLRQFAEHVAQQQCWGGDGCPPGVYRTCDPCLARSALAAKGPTP